ncbi:MAG TPA: permease-like cell division protein FtsX [Nocardioidaceae bacterium]|nr:permease-like cell division protein FtsX [Nocardioidaceae bacterium]
MQMTYVFSDLLTGLRRNVSMVISVVVTIAVSMTLVAVGLLLNTQVAKAEETLGSKLQVVVYLCNERSSSANCVSGGVTEQQKKGITQKLEQSKYVDFYRWESQQEAYKKFQQIYVSDDKAEQRYYNQVKPKDLKESFWITLHDPQDYDKVGNLARGTPGVDSVQDLRDVLDPLYSTMNKLQQGALWLAALLVVSAILQVSNTIRLAAFARRREIGIMRLVGASSWYIQLPFLLESVIAALFGVGFACGAVFALMKWFIYPSLHGESQLMAWVDWGDALVAMGWITLGGLALAVVPTLVMTRKYLRV